MASKKELYDKLALLDTFESNLKIMEFEILKQLEKYKKLYSNNLFNLIQNSTIMENISKRWVSNDGTFFEGSTKKAIPRLFILVGPKKIDKFMLTLLGKFAETMGVKIKKTDFVVSVGEYVNEIVKRIGLTVVAHFPISLLDQNFDFLDKISSIIKVLASKHLISEAHIMYSETDLDKNGDILEKKILPISINNWKENLENDEDLAVLQNLNSEYEEVFAKSYEDDVEWYPSILDINSYMIDAIIKLKLDILTNRKKMKFFQREFQLIQSKKDKIKDEQVKIQLGLNKIRKEEITNDILILASAFKKNEEEEEEEEL